MALNSLPPSYDQFILTYYLNNTEKTLTELHNLLQIAKLRMNKNHASTATNAPVLAIRSRIGKRGKAHSWSGRQGKADVGGSSSGSKSKPNFDVTTASDPKEATCFHYGKKGSLEKKLP